MNAVSPQSSAATGAGLPYLPVFLDVRGRTALLIGGGAGTSAKLDLLRRAGAWVRLVMPRLDPVLREQVLGDSLVEVVEAPVDARHFAQAIVAVDASGDPDVNDRAQRLAHAAGIPLNVVDRPALCNFVFPAILDRAPVIVAISTGGVAPAIARLIRQRLETAIPAGFGRLAVLAARFRSVVGERLTSPCQRARFWEHLFDGAAARLALAGRIDDACALADSLVDELEGDSGTTALYTLEVTSDDPDLLTVRAARLLKMADIIVHDPAISAEILGLGRRDARRLSFAAYTANDMALEAFPGSDLPRDGLTVYLKAGQGEQRTGPRERN
jgi:uroporphyrin-III C-methyltransferase/precorrin-2 dehydrogenase/sirohydrochlorin ferrochelatase